MVETGHKFHDNAAKQIAWAHWFTFFNIVAISLISLRYIAYSGLADSALGITYQFISLVGHFSFLAAVVFGLFLFPLAFIIRHNLTYRLTSICIATIAITFLIVDTQIFRLYQFHLNPLIWQFLQKPEQVETIYSINLHYISIPIIFVLELFFSLLIWKKVRKLQSKRIGKLIAAVLVSCFVLSHLIFIWADANQYRPITNEKSLYPLSYPMTARTFLIRHGWLDKDTLQKRELKQDGTDSTRLNYPRKPLLFNHDIERENLNLLLINVESLRADMLNPTNMPHLSKLSESGLRYNKHFSGANESDMGVFSLFYGLPNIYWKNVIRNHISPVLVNTISNEQRDIGLFSSIGFIHPEFLQSSFSQLKQQNNVAFSPAENNTQTLSQWQKWISHRSQPWFSYLYLEQPNSQQFDKAGNRTIQEQSQQLALYQKQIATVDKQLQSVVDQLKQLSQYEKTIIIITGTHGLTFKGPTSNDTLINAAHVPLVIIWPNKQAKQIHKITSHVDIVPTLMKHLFLVQNNSTDYSSGIDLFSDEEHQYVLSGDDNNYVLYQTDKITYLSRRGEIRTIDWQGNDTQQSEEKTDITVLIDLLQKLRRFTAN